MKDIACEDLLYHSHPSAVALSDNRDLQDEVKKGVKMLTVDIEKTPFYRIGLKQGVKNTTFENAILMMEKFNHSIDDMVQAFNIRKEDLLEYMKKKKENQSIEKE